ncbi:MAG: F0F1 ATP synthase subunit A [Bacilli bacterium]|nr:F0F1 ATP synthase subunit A [Bacilli bacterium]
MIKVLAGLNLDKLTSTNPKDILSGTFLSTIILCFLLSMFALFCFLSSKRHEKDDVTQPKGLFGIIVLFVDFIENFIVGIMGERNRDFAKIMFPTMLYLFVSFIFGLTGLPSPMQSLSFPLMFGFFALILIHTTSIKYKKWGYFKRYVEPLWPFLPINLLSMWSPVLSLSLRLFGNITAGYCLMTVFYFGFASIGKMITNAATTWGPTTFFFPSPITAVLHLYFDLFTALIQTAVYSMVTMILVLQEQPEEPEQVINEIQIQ